MGAPGQEVGVEDVDVAVVVPQRSRPWTTSRCRARPAGRGRPVLELSNVMFFPQSEPPRRSGCTGCRRGTARTGWGASASRSRSRRTRRARRSDEVDERRYAVRDQRLRAGPGDPERLAGHRRTTRRPGRRRPPGGRRPPTWCRRPGPSRRPRRAATAGTAAPGPAPRAGLRSAPAPAAPSGRGTSRGRATRQCTAHSTKKATKMSRRASRESTKCSPSKQTSSPRRSRAGRAGEAADEPDHHQDQQRPDDRRYDPPAERVEPERLLAQADQPLADLGVDDHRRVGLPEAGRLPGQDLLVRAVVVDVVAGVAEVPQRPRVLGVVRLVELERVGRAELPQPQEQRRPG